MNDLHFYRNSAYQARRIAFILRIAALVWAVTMFGIFVVHPSIETFFVGVLGAFMPSFSMLLLVEVFEARAENYFFLARKAKATTPLLGVVSPKS
jgi:bacteriorhodopsin